MRQIGICTLTIVRQTFPPSVQVPAQLEHPIPTCSVLGRMATVVFEAQMPSSPDWYQPTSGPYRLVPPVPRTKMGGMLRGGGGGHAPKAMACGMLTNLDGRACVRIRTEFYCYGCGWMDVDRCGYGWIRAVVDTSGCADSLTTLWPTLLWTRESTKAVKPPYT